MKKKPMSFFTLPVSTANLVYNVSFIALLIGTAVALISCVALVWSNSVRERDTAERLAHLEATNAQAQAAAGKAKADLTEANRLLAQANADIAAEKKVDESKADGGKTSTPPLGRAITLDNRQLFIDFVRTVSKGRVEVEAIASDQEATQFARQVADMLTGAGYAVTENYGSAVLLGNAPVGLEMRIRSMDEQPMYAGSLQKGLEFIGIPTTGSLDPAAGDSVLIFVGTKP